MINYTVVKEKYICYNFVNIIKVGIIMLNSRDIRRQIYSYKEKINCSNHQIIIFENQLEELYLLKSNYINVENSFHEYNHNHRNKAKQLEECIPHFMFSKRFSETIREVVNGYMFENISANIESVQIRIDRKIQELIGKSEECKSNIRIFERKISDLEYQLKYILNKGE